MHQRSVLLHRVGSAGGVQSQRHHRGLVLLDEQLVAVDHVGEAVWRTRAEPGHRAPISTVAVGQGARGVLGVGAEVVHPTRITARQGVIIKDDHRVLRDSGRVVIDRDGELARSCVAISVRHLVAHVEVLVVLVQTLRMHQRRVLLHRVRSAGGVQGQRHHRGLALLDEELVAVDHVGEALRCTRAEPGHRATISTVVVAQGSRDILHIGIHIPFATGYATGQCIIIQLSNQILLSTGSRILKTNC